MEIKSYKGMDLSRLILGTVQFGMNYGIANKKGKPSYETARDILSCAYENGVNCLDTAHSYGNSEEILGKALKELGIQDKMTLVSKVSGIPEDLSPKEADSFLENMIQESLHRLNLDSLPFCLLHNEEDAPYLETLIRLRDKGLIQHAGISVYSPDVTLSILNEGEAEAIQIPASILDHRFQRSGVCKEAEAKGVGLFVRSVYLQGLVLMPRTEIPSDLAGVIPARHRLEVLARESGMTMAELALRYAISMEEVTSILVGVDSVEQLQQNIKIFSKGSLDASMLRSINEAVPNLPESILIPSRWKHQATA